MYALALIPHLVPTLYTYSEVSSKVFGGADLFLQGVISPAGGVEPFLAGSVRSVSVPGNPTPFAVGVMAVSKAEAEREGMKGRGLTLMHHFGDFLWQAGDRVAPNEGFTPTRIFPIQTQQPEEENSADLIEEGADASAGGGAVDGGLAALRMGEQAEPSGNASAAESEDQRDCGAAAEGSSSGGGVDMDALLEAAVLGGLLSIKNSELPMMTSDFYTRHMQPLKPEGVTFDFKQSKYKKLSKLLDAFEKEKVLTQKQIRKQDHISAVHRTHPLLAGWKGMPGAQHGAAGGTAGGKQSGASGTTVEVLYRAPSTLRPVFGAAGADKDRLYSATEVAQALDAYALAGSLMSQAGSKTMSADALLTSALWGKKEAPGQGEALPVVEVRRRLLEKLQPWHRVRRLREGGVAVEVVRKGTLKPIAILSEKRSGRTVTAVSRVEGFGFVPDDLAAALQRKCQAACTVSKLPGKVETDCEIMLQGDQVKQVVAFLTVTEGIEAKYLDVTNKLKK